MLQESELSCFPQSQSDGLYQGTGLSGASQSVGSGQQGYRRTTACQTGRNQTSATGRSRAAGRRRTWATPGSVRWRPSLRPAGPCRYRLAPPGSGGGGWGGGEVTTPRATPSAVRSGVSFSDSCAERRAGLLPEGGGCCLMFSSHPQVRSCPVSRLAADACLRGCMC